MTEEEALEHVLDAVRDRPPLRQALTALLRQEAFHRKYALQAFVRALQHEGAAKDVLHACAYLLDDRLAATALARLESELR